jgi:DNA-binding IclR family transcriptional regulator
MSERGSVPDLEDGDRDFVTAVARAFAILRSYKRSDRALGNRDLAARTGLPKSTIARLTHTLTKLGYLDYQPEHEKYALGVGVLTFAQSYLAGLDLRDVARPLMQELAEYASGTVVLAARHDDDMVLLELCQGNPMFSMRLSVGERVPRGSTALGRAVYAALPDELRQARMRDYERSFKKEDWPRVLQGLDQSVRDYRKHGFVFSIGDWNKEICAVSVPMLSADNARALAFSCTGQAHALPRTRLLNDIGPRLIELRDRVKVAVGDGF